MRQDVPSPQLTKWELLVNISNYVAWCARPTSGSAQSEKEWTEGKNLLGK